MLDGIDARFSQLYFGPSLNTLHLGLPAIVGLLVQLTRSSCQIIAFDKRMPLVNTLVLRNLTEFLHRSYVGKN